MAHTGTFRAGWPGFRSGRGRHPYTHQVLEGVLAWPHRDPTGARGLVRTEQPLALAPGVDHAANMAITRIQTAAAPLNPLFAQGVRAGGFVFVSGTVGIDPATGTLAGETIGEQTTQALANCTAIVEAAGGSKNDIVEVGILLHDQDDFAGMNAAYANWLPDRPPARYAAKLGAVIPGVLISIRMTAYVG